mgnify:CR=1 FL=1
MVRASSRQGEGPQFESEYSHQVCGFGYAKTQTSESMAGNREANAESDIGKRQQTRVETITQ